MIDGVDYREMVNPAYLAGLTIYSESGAQMRVVGEAAEWSRRLGTPCVLAVDVGNEHHTLIVSVWCLRWTPPPALSTAWRYQGAARVGTLGQMRQRARGDFERGVWPPED